jgi:ABC-2 type transport system permease protein
MRTIFYIVQKEFLQVFRNRMMLPIIFVIPVVQLLILSYAVTFEIKNINLYVVDNDNSVSSRSLLEHFRSSPFYHIVGQGADSRSGMEFIQNGKAHQMLVLLPGFEKNLVTGTPARVQVINDAINGSSAALMSAYTVSIINEYNKGIITTLQPEAASAMDVRWSFWFNPELDYKTYMVPGILVLLVTIIGMFLSGMNVVREKEIGTIEQINVTPIKKYQFIAGKLIPFWIIALFELALGLLAARLIFDIPLLAIFSSFSSLPQFIFWL